MSEKCQSREIAEKKPEMASSPLLVESSLIRRVRLAGARGFVAFRLVLATFFDIEKSARLRFSFPLKDRDQVIRH